MKRSEINEILLKAKEFMAEKQFSLPPWAFWSIDDWKNNKVAAKEVIDNMLDGILRILALVIFINRDCFYSRFGMAS